MIGCIEGFKPELQISALGEVEILQRGKIPTKKSRASGDIAPDIAESADRLRRQGLNVKPFAGRRVAEAGAGAGSVRSIVADSCVRAVYSVGDVFRKTARIGHDGTELPA